MFEVLNDAEIALKAYFDQDHQPLQAAVLAIFAGMNSIRIVAYVPQIVKAGRDTNGASAISYTTWSLFLASHLTTILYAIVCLGDLVMAAVFLGNALACITIILVALWNSRQYQRRLHEDAFNAALADGRSAEFTARRERSACTGAQGRNLSQCRRDGNHAATSEIHSP